MLPYIYPFGTQISMYHTMILCGVIAMIINNVRTRKQLNIGVVTAVVYAIFLFILGCIGAKILFILENPEYYAKNGLTLGGVSFYGAVLLLPPMLAVMALLIRKKPLEYLDYCTPSVILMITLFRLGCFCAGCCGGMNIEIFGVMVTPPAQLIECACDILILGRILNWKTNIVGARYPRFMIEYGVARFFIEFIRINEKGMLGLTGSQWLSLLSIALGLIAYYVLKNKEEKKNEITTN